MKTGSILIAMAMVAMLVLTACSKSNQIDTSKLEKSFQGSGDNAKVAVSAAVDSIKKQDYNNALANLQKLASQAKLTPEQDQAIKDVMAQVQNALKEMASKATEGANKALGDLQKAVPK